MGRPATGALQTSNRISKRLNDIAIPVFDAPYGTVQGIGSTPNFIKSMFPINVLCSAIVGGTNGQFPGFENFEFCTAFAKGVTNIFPLNAGFSSSSFLNGSITALGAIGFVGGSNVVGAISYIQQFPLGILGNIN